MQALQLLDSGNVLALPGREHSQCGEVVVLAVALMKVRFSIMLYRTMLGS